MNHTMRVVLPSTTDDAVALLLAMAHSLFMEANEIARESKLKESDPVAQEKIENGDLLKKAAEEMNLRKKLRRQLQSQKKTQETENVANPVQEGRPCGDQAALCHSGSEGDSGAV